MVGGNRKRKKWTRTRMKRGRNVALHFNQKAERFSVEFTGRECLIAVIFLLIYIPSRCSLIIEG